MTRGSLQGSYRPLRSAGPPANSPLTPVRVRQEHFLKALGAACHPCCARPPGSVMPKGNIG